MQHGDTAYTRNGNWLEMAAETIVGMSGPAGSNIPPLEAGSHPHAVRLWLLALGVFPEKWVNRLFSTGGIRYVGDAVMLRAFDAVNPADDPIYRLALQPPESPLAAGVLYEDDWCIVLDKPSGMPVHPSKPGERGTLDEACARHCLSIGDSLPVRHIHRLDDDTAGPVLYAKNDLAQHRLDEAMRAKLIDRGYEAIVQGRMKRGRGTIDAPIGKDRHHGARRRVSPSGDHAVTHYEIIEACAGASLIRLRLETGRTHQIRVHLSHLGHPLVGDMLYGGSDRLLGHQALRGERLTFAHPFTGKATDVVCPAPAWFRELREMLSLL